VPIIIPAKTGIQPLLGEGSLTMGSYFENLPENQSCLTGVLKKSTGLRMNLCSIKRSKQEEVGNEKEDCRIVSGFFIAGNGWDVLGAREIQLFRDVEIKQCKKRPSTSVLPAKAGIHLRFHANRVGIGSGRENRFKLLITPGGRTWEPNSVRRSCQGVATGTVAPTIAFPHFQPLDGPAMQA
jgi:hypothetical protein